MSESEDNKIGIFLRRLCYLLPVLLVVFGIYFCYTGIYIRNKISKTYDDVITTNTNIKNFYTEKFKNFDTESVVLNNLLPFDAKSGSDESGYVVYNRFGGRIFFYEAFYTVLEKRFYMNLYDNQEKYKRIYPGTTAYIMLYTGLSRRECRLLAQTDWKSFIKNYVGMEVSFLDARGKHNGVFNLKTQLLSEADNYHLDSKDSGIISAEPLSEQESQTVCSCKKDNCTVALKFH